MQSDDEAPLTLTKWPFYLGDLIFVAAAIAVALLGDRPLETMQMVTCVVAVALGNVMFVLPYLYEYWMRVREVDDDRVSQIRMLKGHMQRTESALQQCHERLVQLETGDGAEDQRYELLATTVDHKLHVSSQHIATLSHQLGEIETFKAEQLAAFADFKTQLEALDAASKKDQTHTLEEAVTSLRSELSAVETRLQTALEPVTALESRLVSLEDTVKQVEEAAEKAKLAEAEEPPPARSPRIRRVKGESSLLHRAISEKQDAASTAVSRIIDSKSKLTDLLNTESGTDEVAEDDSLESTDTPSLSEGEVECSPEVSTEDMADEPTEAITIEEAEGPEVAATTEEEQAEPELSLESSSELDLDLDSETSDTVDSVPEGDVQEEDETEESQPTQPEELIVELDPVETSEVEIESIEGEPEESSEVAKSELSKSHEVSQAADLLEEDELLESTQPSAVEDDSDDVSDSSIVTDEGLEDLSDSADDSLGAELIEEDELLEISEGSEDSPSEVSEEHSAEASESVASDEIAVESEPEAAESTEPMDELAETIEISLGADLIEDDELLESTQSSAVEDDSDDASDSSIVADEALDDLPDSAEVSLGADLIEEDESLEHTENSEDSSSEVSEESSAEASEPDTQDEITDESEPEAPELTESVDEFPESLEVSLGADLIEDDELLEISEDVEDSSSEVSEESSAEASEPDTQDEITDESEPEAPELTESVDEFSESLEVSLGADLIEDDELLEASSTGDSHSDTTNPEDEQVEVIESEVSASDEVVKEDTLPEEDAKDNTELDGLFAESVPTATRRAFTKADEAVLTVSILIGIGNKPFLRGSGGGLSWQAGVPMDFEEIGKWRWVAPADLEEPIEVHVYRNDEDPDRKGRYMIEPGQKLEVSPVF